VKRGWSNNERRGRDGQSRTRKVIGIDPHARSPPTFQPWLRHDHTAAGETLWEAYSAPQWRRQRGGKGKASPLWVYGKIGKQLPNPTNSLCTVVNVSASGGLRTLDLLPIPQFPPPLLQNPGGATGAPYTPTSLTPAGEALLCNWVTQLLLDYSNVFWYLNTKQTVHLTRVKSCSHNRFLAANQQTDIHWLLAVYIFIKLNY